VFRPAYLELLASGVLDERVDAACTCRSSTTPAGYDSLEALALLDGVVDLYMPDMKYADSAIAHRYSHVRDYWEVNRAAVKEMHRQVGDLVLDDQGIAQRGLLVRHLVLPGHLAGTEHVVEFLAHEISPATYLNLMDQYRPCYRAAEHPPLDRRVTAAEYRAALACGAPRGSAPPGRVNRLPVSHGARRAVLPDMAVLRAAHRRRPPAAPAAAELFVDVRPFRSG